MHQNSYYAALALKKKQVRNELQFLISTSPVGLELTNQYWSRLISSLKTCEDVSKPAQHFVKSSPRLDSRLSTT